MSGLDDKKTFFFTDPKGIRVWEISENALSNLDMETLKALGEEDDSHTTKDNPIVLPCGKVWELNIIMKYIVLHEEISETPAPKTSGCTGSAPER